MQPAMMMKKKLAITATHSFAFYVIQKLIQDAMASYTAPASWLDDWMNV